MAAQLEGGTELGTERFLWSALATVGGGGGGGAARGASGGGGARAGA